MNREQWLEQADLYSAGTLSPEEESVFEARLAEGDEISKALLDLVGQNRNAIADSLLNLPLTQPPPELREQTLRKAFGESPGGDIGRHFRGLWILLMIFVVTVLVTVAVLLYTAPTKSTTETEFSHLHSLEANLPVEPIIPASEKQPQAVDFQDTIGLSGSPDSSLGRDIEAGAGDSMVDQSPSPSHYKY